MLIEQKMATESHVLHPHRHLLVNGLVAALALTTPVFAVAYWLTIGAGSWPWILALHALAVVIALLIVLRYYRTTITVTADGVRERGFFGGVSEISASEIGSLHLVEIYRDSTLDTQPNLFIVDRRGEVRIRLRGQYWPRNEMEIVADVLDLPLVSSDESITLSELRAARPDWLYWFERLPVVSWL